MMDYTNFLEEITGTKRLTFKKVACAAGEIVLLIVTYAVIIYGTYAIAYAYS